MTSPVRVLIVDDHPIYRSGLAAAITSFSGLELVGEANDGETAIALAGAESPDVVLMDLGLPGIDGVETTRRLVERHPGIHVIVLTMSEDSDSIWASMRAGAHGYLVKGSNRDDIHRAIEAVSTGEILFGPIVAQQVTNFFQASTNAPKAFPQLTSRETEVLEYVAAGHTNADIASRLYVSGKTIRNHVSNIFTKMNVSSRNEAISRARAAGLVDQPRARP